MTEKTIADEQKIIAEALRRRERNEPTIPAETMKKLKSLFGEEIKRTGTLGREYVDALLQQAIIGEL